MKPVNAHVDRVLSASQLGSAPAKSQLVTSWRRPIALCVPDPAQRPPAGRINTSALEERRTRLDQFLQVAGPKLDQLFVPVGQSVCAVLPCDGEGAGLNQRCHDGDRTVFQGCGLWQGTDWSEPVEGTNGIGTVRHIFLRDSMAADGALLDKAVDGFVRFAFKQSGVCTCPSRALIRDDIHKELVACRIAAGRAIRLGDPSDMATMVGAQSGRRQHDKNLSRFPIGEAEGAESLVGGDAARFNGDLAWASILSQVS